MQVFVLVQTIRDSTRHLLTRQAGFARLASLGVVLARWLACGFRARFRFGGAAARSVHLLVLDDVPRLTLTSCGPLPHSRRSMSYRYLPTPSSHLLAALSSVGRPLHPTWNVRASQERGMECACGPVAFLTAAFIDPWRRPGPKVHSFIGRCSTPSHSQLVSPLPFESKDDADVVFP